MLTGHSAETSSTQLTRKIVGFLTPIIGAFSLVSTHAIAQPAMDPLNPTCPANPDWSTHREMRFTAQDVDGRRVLLAEGQIDDDMVQRLEQALRDPQIEEVWLRSPGGNAMVGNRAGRLLRGSGVSTRIPSGWTCFGACAFMFMGGITRQVDDGGFFMVAAGVSDFTEADVAGGGAELANEIAEASALLANDDNDYLIRMGLSRNLLADILHRRSEDGSTRRCLSQEELRRYNVVNQVFRR